MTDGIRDLDEFSFGSRWTKFEDASLYIRISPRMVSGPGLRRWYVFLDLASVGRSSRRDNIDYDPYAVSTGFMNRLMTELESHALVVADGVYVESVLNGWLADWFLRRGYQLVFEGESPPSLYRLNEAS